MITMEIFLIHLEKKIKKKKKQINQMMKVKLKIIFKRKKKNFITKKKIWQK